MGLDGIPEGLNNKSTYGAKKETTHFLRDGITLANHCGFDKVPILESHQNISYDAVSADVESLCSGVPKNLTPHRMH